MKKGKVYLVGAGPGDPGLFTVRGSECLRRAEVVVYDHLVNPALLAGAPKGARLIYAGKSGGNHTLTQERINALLVREALQGKTVVRLKGGDPVLFARGAEEGLELARHGIPFEIVPGVSAALAVPSAAGIPLTYRSLASTVTFVTGHESADKSAPVVAWKKLLDRYSTVVVLMGVANLKKIARRLGHPRMPCAVVREGTLPSQQVVTGTLATIAGLVEEKRLLPPAILVAGRVAGLRDELWRYMEKPFLPLAGKHVLVTRPAAAGEEFAALLREKGAKVSLFPLIRSVPAPARAVDAVVRQAASFRWIVLSSTGGADLFAAALRRNGIPRRLPATTGLAAIGPKTAERLRAHGLAPELLPREYRQEGLTEEFAKLDGRGKVLLLHAKESREFLEERLREQGFDVTACDLYRTQMVGSPAHLRRLLAAGPVDVVTVTSSVCARSLARLLEDPALRCLRRTLAVAALGPVCARTARSLGLRVRVVAEEYTVEGLTDALERHFKKSAAGMI